MYEHINIKKKLTPLRQARLELDLLNFSPMLKSLTNKFEHFKIEAEFDLACLQLNSTYQHTPIQAA